MSDTRTIEGFELAVKVDSISIENLRGIREGRLEGFSPLSVLVGPNNCGKSTVLEAIAATFLAENDDGARRVASLLLRRGGPALHALASSRYDASKAVRIVVERKAGTTALAITIGGTKVVAQLDHARSEGLVEPMTLISTRMDSGLGSSVLVDRSGRVATPFAISARGRESRSTPLQLVDIEAVRRMGTLENAYSTIRKAGLKERVIQSLASSFKGLEDMETLKEGDDHILFTFRGGQPIPAYVAGDGFKRYLQIAAALATTGQGVALLEEPETYQHPRYMGELVSLLVGAAEGGTQVMLATHNIEFIDMLLEETGTHGEQFLSVHRLALMEGRLAATALNRRQALLAREDLLKDLRA